MIKRKPWRFLIASRFFAMARWSKSLRPAKSTRAPPPLTPPNSSARPTCFAPSFAKVSPIAARFSSLMPGKRAPHYFRCARKRLRWPKTPHNLPIRFVSPQPSVSKFIPGPPNSSNWKPPPERSSARASLLANHSPVHTILFSVAATPSLYATKNQPMYSRAYKFLVAPPPILWVSLFLLLPYWLMFAHSFWAIRDGVILHQWNLSNYGTLFRNPLYVQVLFRTVRIAAAVTILSVLLGYPLAYFLSFHAGRRQELLYQLVIVPLWVSYLVRGYAWKTILGSDGVLNGFLQYLHITHGPVSALLYSPFAVVLMLTHIYTPFVFLPIYASLEHIPHALIEASQDLA